MSILVIYALLTTLYLIFNNGAHSKRELEAALINKRTLGYRKGESK